MTSAGANEIRTDQGLLAEGWERRFLADPLRCAEMVELYTSLGFEVHLARLAPRDFGEGCGDCSQVVCAQHVLMYTRRRQDDEGSAP